jgi:hypothetical protein
MAGDCFLAPFPLLKSRLCGRKPSRVQTCGVDTESEEIVWWIFRAAKLRSEVEKDYASAAKLAMSCFGSDDPPSEDRLFNWGSSS